MASASSEVGDLHKIDGKNSRVEKVWEDDLTGRTRSEVVLRVDTRP